MLDEPQIVQAEARLTAVIRFTILREEIQTVMGPAIGEVTARTRGSARPGARWLTVPGAPRIYF